MITISDEVEQICQKIGVYRYDCARIVINPTEVVAYMYEKNEVGRVALARDGRRAVVHKVRHAVRT